MAIQSFLQAKKNDNQPFEVVVGDNTYKGFFVNVRVDRNTLPKGWHAYDLRDSEDGVNVSELKAGYIVVNHFGTFCTRKALPINNGESLYYYGDDEDDNEFEYSFC